MQWCGTAALLMFVPRYGGRWNMGWIIVGAGETMSCNLGTWFLSFVRKVYAVVWCRGFFRVFAVVWWGVG